MTRPLDLRGREHKYGVAPVEARTYNGIVYHSKAEAEYAKRLDLMMKAAGSERVVSWSRQVAIPLAVNGHHVCDYRVDFAVLTADGKMHWVEIKGMETSMWRLKYRLFQVLYPERKLLIVAAK